jgi:hypothetical protein
MPEPSEPTPLSAGAPATPDTTSPPAAPPPMAASANSPQPGAVEKPIPFNIGEEFGTAKKNLPPAKVVVIVLGALAVIAMIFIFVERPQPAGGGSIGEVVAVEVPDQNQVMVAINVEFRNNGKAPFWIRSIKADLDTGTRVVSDEAASAMDFDRYFQALPALKAHAEPPLKREDKILPGDEGKGTMIVTFPVTAEEFGKRKSLKVSIMPYDQPVPVVLTQ